MRGVPLPLKRVLLHRIVRIAWKQRANAGLLVLCLLGSASASFSAVVDYDLVIAREARSITEETVQAMTINGSIPGPVLRFNEGDTARIRVRNDMNVDTSIHWHGLLVPPGMDGVPYVSFPPIAPGQTFTYEFPIRQSGTYWYHSHTSLQEQRGVYGGIVILPSDQKPAASDHVVLLSDWTDRDPDTVLHMLKRGSEWFSIEKGSSQSIIGAARLGMLSDYLSRELQRMPAMDIADVAYDRFLANGRPDIEIPAEPGQRIRIRIIDGSATTFFHLLFSGGPLSIVSADGQDVEPVEVDRLLIGVAETYDVMVTVPSLGAYELRAAAHDGSGYASVWIGTGEHHPAPSIPKPNLYHTMGDLSLARVFALTPDGSMGMTDRDVRAGRFDGPGMMPMGGMDMGHHMGEMEQGQGPAAMEHAMDMGQASESEESASHAMNGMGQHGMEHSADMPADVAAVPKRSGRPFGLNFRPLASDVSSTKDLAVDGMDPQRPGPPYAKLRSTRETTISKEHPVREIRLTLDGDMGRYVWFMNKKPLSETESILIRQGETVRFIMINRTMMHHPMHLHGHFFRVLNGQGDRAPLKHTVDVEPMSTTVIEFEANEFGDWFFHCHLLYHMKSGMARVVHYEGYDGTPEVSAIRKDLYKEAWYAWGEADVLTNMTEGYLQVSDTRNIIAAHWEAGWKGVDDTQWEGILTWDRSVNRFFSVFAGADLLGEDDTFDETRGILGFRYLLPFSIDTRVWLDSEGASRFSLEKEFRLMPRLDLVGEVQYDTDDLWEGKTGLAYTLSKSISLLAQWHSDYYWGGGIRVRF